jgi:hypothetical protein
VEFGDIAEERGGLGKFGEISNGIGGVRKVRTVFLPVKSVHENLGKALSGQNPLFNLPSV